MYQDVLLWSGDDSALKSDFDVADLVDWKFIPIRSFEQLMALPGEISIEVYRDKLRLRIPRKYTEGVQKCIYTQQPNDAAGWRKATQLVWWIQDDIEAGIFDPTLEKYKPESGFKPKVLGQYSLLELWDKYTEYKKPQLSVTHYEINYCSRYRNSILELPNPSLINAIAIRDHLLKTKTPATAKQLLVQYNACCNWAVDSKLIAKNPFEGMAAKIKNKRHDAEAIDPFTATERDAIIKAFEEHPHYRHYANFVKFLFLTGARTSEAIGLRWAHVNQQCTMITFQEALTKGVRKDTKTGKSRRFPCGDVLQSLLLSIRPDNYQPDDLVFLNSDGRPIKAASFTHNAWKGDHGKAGIVTKLIEEGKVERYRPQYCTRHTFITEALQDGTSVSQIARWTGNSADTLLRHYAGVTTLYRPPEF